MVGSRVSSAIMRVLQSKALSDSQKVFIGVSICFAICAYPVWGKSVKEGHDLFSSEKPAAVRNEKERQLEQERQKLEEGMTQQGEGQHRSDDSTSGR